ncbi:MAG: ribosomal protein L11 methyltransferase [Porticoccus sp.]|jgi:ribosomal protein L11 methyltransferase
MPWLQLRINSSREQAERIEDVLLEIGAASVTFEDNADEPILEPALGETPLWGQTRITGLFDAETNTDATNQILKNKLGQTLLDRSWELLEDKDWEREWMKHYQPIQCGERLWICPSWLAPPQPDSINLLLDPGVAFGTGTHPTTFLCLQWLDGTHLDGKTVTDYGCGSGILAIASLLLGATSTICVDIDPQALSATADNAQRNGLSPDRTPAYLPDLAPEKTTDIMIANILAGPLVSLAPKLASLTNSGGSLCLSGIIENQAQEVIDSYQPWFDFDPPASREQWVRLTAVKR